MIGIETIVDCSGWRIALPDAELRALKVFSAASEREPRLRGSAALLLTDDAAVRNLNARFRQQDAPTNVLSFPSEQPAPAFLGDVALGFETCRREAQEKGVSLADHFAHLLTHGLLHLAGYDHISQRDAEVMECLELEILDAMGVSNPYEGEETEH